MNWRRLTFAVWLGTLLGSCGGRVDEIDASGREPGGSGPASGGGATGGGGHAASGGRPVSGAGSASVAGSSGAGASGAGGRGEGGAASDGGQGGDSGGTSGAGGGTGGNEGSAARGGGGGGAGAGGGEGSVAEVWVGQSATTITYPDVVHYSWNVPQHVVLVISTSAEGVVTGSILFGDREPPPRATDPDAFYPPLADGPSLQLLRSEPLNGFAYTLRDLHIQDGRLTAWFETSELWSDWCALQTRSYPALSSIESEERPGTCAPQDAPTSKGRGEPLKGDLCQELTPAVCACANDACQAYPNAYRKSLDIQLRGALYEGKVEDDNYPEEEFRIPWLKLRRVE